MASTDSKTTANAPSAAVGWIGLGSMGTGMAKNIQKHLSASGAGPLRVYNRTASRCAPLEDIGAKKCESVAELVQGCSIIFISSSDDSAVNSIIEQAISSGAVAGKAFIDTTTVHPDTTKAVAARLSSHGAAFAAMPVFGASPAAEAGKLLAAFAGPQEVLEAISPFIKGVIAREVLVVGAEPDKALLLKTTGNLLMASLMQIIAEAHVFASQTGLPASTLERLLELNFGPVAYSDSTRMTGGVYCPGPGQGPWSDLDLGYKDVGHGIGLGERAGVSLRAGRAAYENLGRAREWAAQPENAGRDGQKRKLDSSSLFGVVRMDSGLDFETEDVKERDRKIMEDKTQE
ncbi:hypothetical protein BX600DRAFT_457366 [Xylariales sp. PMI_506]|nr:hypothetical protein BX600DRAFT_457366 [Xylariales sp. PMI_506]